MAVSPPMRRLARIAAHIRVPHQSRFSFRAWALKNRATSLAGLINLSVCPRDSERISSTLPLAETWKVPTSSLRSARHRWLLLPMNRIPVITYLVPSNSRSPLTKHGPCPPINQVASKERSV